MEKTCENMTFTHVGNLRQSVQQCQRILEEGQEEGQGSNAGSKPQTAVDEAAE